MSITVYSLLAIAICALVTWALRAFPFLLFRGEKGMPARVERLAGMMPAAIIAVLVVYCLKAVPTGTLREGWITMVSVLIVVILHWWKRSTLLSIAGGTALYMLLIRLVP